MSKEPVKYDVLWTISEICYYLGILLILTIPFITFAVWSMSFTDKIDPNYWYFLISWLSSVMMFAVGIGLKNYIYSSKDKN